MTNQMAERWSSGIWIGWTMMAILAAGVAGYALVGIGVGIEKALPSMTYHLPERKLFALAHFGIGGLVLLIGPLQFVSALRAKYPALHRWSGRFYVAGCILSGIAGFALAQYSFGGPFARLGFSLLAIAWIVTTSMAFVRARQRAFLSHKMWMIRSYALTLAAVTLRLYLPLTTGAMGIDIMIVYPIIAFVCWVPNAIVAEWIVRRRQFRLPGSG